MFLILTTIILSLTVHHTVFAQYYPNHQNLPQIQQQQQHHQPPLQQIQNQYPVNHSNQYPVNHSNHTAVESRDSYQGSSSYGWPSHTQDHHHHHHESSNKYPSHGGGGHDHGSSLHSYFDIALTALAFLSFGIFLLNLLLNALLFAGLVTATGTGTQTGGIQTQTMNTGTNTGMTQTGNTNTGGGRVTVTGGSGSAISVIGRRIGEHNNSSSLVNDDESRHRPRGKRATLELFLDPVTSMDSLAHTVLKSIDAMMEKHECVGKVFCEGNRQAKIIGSGFQYLMPLYSMSASYFGKKFGWHENLLDHFTAVLLGVGDSNCHSHFPQC